MRKDLLSQGFKRIKVKNTYGHTLKTHPFMYKTDKYSLIKTNNIQTPSGIITNVNTVGITGTLLPNTQYRLTFELNVQLDPLVNVYPKSIQHIDSIVFQTDNSANATLYHKYFTLTIISSGSTSNPKIEFTVPLLNAQRLKITSLEAINITSGIQKLKKDITPIVPLTTTFSTNVINSFYTTNKANSVINACKINGIYVVATQDAIKTIDSLTPTCYNINSKWVTVRDYIETRHLLYNYHNNTVVAIYNCDKPETTRVIVSSDGVTWNEYSPGFRIWDILDAKDNKGYFVNTSTTSITEPTIYYTEDFITFTATNITSFTNSVISLSQSTTIMYFRGNYFIADSQLHLNRGVITSTDGITWSKTSLGYSDLLKKVLTGIVANNYTHAYALLRVGVYDNLAAVVHNSKTLLAHKQSYLNEWTHTTLSVPFGEYINIYPFSKGVIIFSYKSDTENLISIYTHDSNDNLIGSYQMTVTEFASITDIMEIPSTNEYPAFLILSGSMVYVLEYSTEHSSSVLRAVLELQDTSHYTCGIQMIKGLYIINGYYSHDGRVWQASDRLFIVDSWQDDSDDVGTDITLKELIKLDNNMAIPILEGINYGDLALIHCDQALPGYSEVKTYDQL